MKWFTSRVKRFWQWICRSPKKITIPVTVVLLILISSGIYKAVDFWTYMQHVPEACLSCHIMEEPYASWAASEHQDVACHSCHQQSIFATAKEGVKWILGAEEITKRAVIDNELCENCHGSGNTEGPQVLNTAGHKSHSDEQNIACTECHAVTPHQFEPDREHCLSCHAEAHNAIPGMAERDCTSCHSF